MFIVRTAKAKIKLNEFLTREDAQEALERYENRDKKGFIYTPNFYEIVEAYTAGEAEELVMMNDEKLNADFIAWLADQGKDADLWDYDDLSSFMQSKGFITI